MTLDLLTEVLAQCDATPAAPAITDLHGTLTYGELARRVRGIAAGLRAAGMHQGDRVLFSVRPDPACVVVALGIVAAGGTAAFADPGVGPDVFHARLDLAAPSWVLSESLLYAVSARRAGRALARRRGLYLPDLGALTDPQGRRLRPLHTGRWLPGVPRGSRSTDAMQGLVPQDILEEPDQQAVIVFTSGTTSAPKAVVHSRRSLGGMAAAFRAGCPTGPADVVHTEQLMVGIPVLTTGAHWTMPVFGLAPRADPAGYARGLEGATVTFTVPADFADVLDAVEAGTVQRPRSLRRVLLGAAPVLPPLIRRAERVLPGVEVLAVYGMTEILPIAITPGTEKVAFADGHPGEGDLQGRPLPGVRARIADDGELMVSGDNLCAGILGRPEYAEHATGDLVRIDDEDRMVLVGRKTDMIIRRWTNIYPGLYEPALSALPGVRAAVMVGVPDEIGDERVVLAIVPEGEGTPGGELPSSLIEAPDLVRRVTAALPGLMAATALPDEVVAVSHVPLSGRAHKPDRAVLRTLVQR